MKQTQIAFGGLAFAALAITIAHLGSIQLSKLPASTTLSNAVFHNQDQADWGFVVRPGEHHFFRCPYATKVYKRSRQLLFNTRFWLKEIVENQAPFKGRYFFSPLYIEEMPHLRDYSKISFIDTEKVYYLTADDTVFYSCNTGVSDEDINNPVCGNGLVERNNEEFCDSVDGCGPDCQPLDGYTCNFLNNTCRTQVSQNDDLQLYT